MSDLAEAFDDALDAAEEAKGSRETITLQGEEIDALIFEDVIDIQPGAGGDVDSQPITVSVRTADVSLPIDQLAPITVRGRDLQVLHYAPLEGRVDIVAGRTEEEME